MRKQKTKKKQQKPFLDNYQRILKIDEMISQNNFPSVKDFVNQTGASIPTINRDLRDLRKKYGAGKRLKYDRFEKGFYYSEPFKVTPAVPAEKNTAAVEKMLRLLRIIRGPYIYQNALDVFLSLNGDKENNPGLDSKKLSDRILFLDMEPVKIDQEIWSKLEKAMSRNNYVSFEYRNLLRRFVVQPLQLVYSDGMWSLYAYNQNLEIR